MQYSIIGDIIVVRPGEKVPLDGVVVSGHSTLDTAALTGESLPRDVSCGSDILSGCINLSGLIEVRCEKEFGRSTVSKILELVENATSQKAKTENFITRFAAVYTPAVVGVAMGGLGSDAAIEAADIVIMDDKPSKLLDLMKISRQTLSIVKQNIVFALGIKLIVLLLSALGLANMWAAVFADVGVSIIAIINSMRTMKKS